MPIDKIFPRYLSLRENLKLKKMFLVFLNKEDQERASKLEKFKFIAHPMADDFKKAMLKDLENHLEGDLLFKDLFQKLDQQVKEFKCSIAADCLSMCYQYS